MTDSEQLNPLTGETTGFVDERRQYSRLREGYNGSFGAEWYLSDNLTWYEYFIRIEEIVG